MNDAKITIVLPKELKEEIEKLAKDKNISVNSAIRLAISELIQRNK